MLGGGLKFVVAKSKELQTKIADAGASSQQQQQQQQSAKPVVEPPPPSRAAGSGAAFLALQQQETRKALAAHTQLLNSGEQLADALADARRQLQAQSESAQFVRQHFHEVASVREQLARMRGLVAKIAEDAEDVEQFLLQKTEEYMAAQNAAFAARQQEELELFEERILDEKEDLKRQLLEKRRQQLANAFENDLRTYQTLVSYQGDSLAKTVVSETNDPTETLESIDLIVTADADQLNAFYDSASDENESDAEESKSQSSGDLKAVEVGTDDLAPLTDEGQQQPADRSVDLVEEEEEETKEEDREDVAV